MEPVIIPLHAAGFFTSGGKLARVVKFAASKLNRRVLMPKSVLFVVLIYGYTEAKKADRLWRKVKKFGVYFATVPSGNGLVYVYINGDLPASVLCAAAKYGLNVVHGTTFAEGAEGGEGEVKESDTY